MSQAFGMLNVLACQMSECQLCRNANWFGMLSVCQPLYHIGMYSQVPNKRGSSFTVFPIFFHPPRGGDQIFTLISKKFHPPRLWIYVVKKEEDGTFFPPYSFIIGSSFIRYLRVLTYTNYNFRKLFYVYQPKYSSMLHTVLFYHFFISRQIEKYFYEQRK